ncbi:small heat shock protein, chloroplastic-like [Salvia miltiorrhiza]|uniref:small heat shock protein, chloroplastic-like n=1 Tax=Salvia miltiorrhiza TaxID=226208 RepID=UPI0025ACFC56|nr:small heat shock protein, chloroplastic-like [Salvia miltiorrhiza]
MSHCLSQTALYTPIPPSSRFSYLRKSPISGRNCAKIAVRAAAADGRENLDHLQKQNKQPQQPPAAKRRAAPAAPIGLWDRFPTARTVQQMMETMERMMDDPLAYSGGWAPASPPAEAAGYGRGRTPWEIKEGESEYKLRFDMPGMTKEDVKVWVEEKMLVVKAEKKGGNGEGEGEEWPAKSYGRYSSRIALPENVEFEKIKAEVKDGVLYITIPKASSSAKVFDISVN